MNARRLIAALVVLLAAAFVGSAAAVAAPEGGVTVSATLNGQDIAGATTSEPLRLDPGTTGDVVLKVTNNGTEPLVVKRVELAGNILGLTFYRYVAATELTVEPGATGTLSYPIDFADLGRLATGLIWGEVTVRGDSGATTISTVTDVRGSLWSVTGLFGLGLVVFTVVAFVRVALAIARNQLPANRAQRGLRFLLPGVGLLLVLGFTAAMLRLWIPSTGTWLVALGVSAAVFFALGFFSPMPGDEDEYPDDDPDGIPEDIEDDYEMAGQMTERFTDVFTVANQTRDLSAEEPTRTTRDRWAPPAETEGADVLFVGDTVNRHSPTDRG